MAKIYEDNSFAIGNTPLVKLKSVTKNAKATVLAKIEGRNPAYSVKCRIGANMIWDAEKSGKLTKEKIDFAKLLKGGITREDPPYKFYVNLYKITDRAHYMAVQPALWKKKSLQNIGGILTLLSNNIFAEISEFSDKEIFQASQIYHNR